MESRDRRGRVRVAASVAAGLPLILVVVYGPARAEAHPGAETATGTVELDGKLRVIVEDAQHSSRTLYFLDTGSGRLSLHFNSKPPTGFLTGQDVHVRGRRTDDTVEVPSGDSRIQPLTLAASASTSTATTTSTSSATASPAPTPLPNTFGEQKTLVIMVNFQDNTARPWTASQVQSAVFGTVNSFFWEGSYGQTWLTGKVCGWYTIPLSSSTCDPNQIAAAAENAAAACANLSAYSRHVYAFPPANCSFGAEGTIGGNPSQAWLDGTIDTGIIAHELGHNFGLYHSHLLDCGTSILSGVCSVQEYGDLYDTMGGEDGHFWAHVQAIKRPTLLEFAGPLFMSYPVSSNLQYRLSEEPGGTLIKFRHLALGLIEEDHRKGVVRGWASIHARVKAAAERGKAN